MIRKSLTIKVFLFVMILFLIQIFGQQAFTKYFLGDFYESEKIQTAEDSFYNSINEFVKYDNVVDQSDVLSEYMDVTGEPILVFKQYDYFSDFHESSLMTSFENAIIVEINDVEHMIPFTQTATIQEDGVAEVVSIEEFDVYELEQQTVLVYGLKQGDDYIPHGFEYQGFYSDYLPVETLDSLVDFEIIDEEPFEELAQVLDVRKRFISSDTQKKIDVITNEFFNNFSGLSEKNDQYRFMFERIEHNDEKLVFVSMLSLQPINEVLAIQGKFQWYMVGAMAVLIIIVSFIFSKLISRPIISVSNTASEIAKLNFDAVCDEKRTDEIGILSKSINTLSVSLKEKIDTLEDEIEFERRQEKIRREFVADVSHELKTPLGVIRSYSEGIKDGISKEKADYYLDVIIEEVDKMNGLVLDMLELSNLESGQLLKKEHINIKRMVLNLLRSYDQVKENMQVSVDLDDVMADVDIKKMELVISNLLSNAFRYVDDRQIINISLKNNELRVENSHEALSDQDMNKLWDRFYRIEKSRSRTFGGNGLGLAIVKKTLDLHDLPYSIENSDLGFLFKIRF